MPIATTPVTNYIAVRNSLILPEEIKGVGDN